MSWGHLWEAFLLKVCNDALSEQRRGLDNIKHFLVVVLQ